MKERPKIVKEALIADRGDFIIRYALSLSDGIEIVGESDVGSARARVDAMAKYGAHCQRLEQAETNVVSLAKAVNGSVFTSPEQILEDAKKDFAEGGEWYGRDKALVLSLDNSDGRFEVDYLNAGLSCSQMLAMAEVLKSLALRDMGYSLMPDQLVTVEE